MGLTPDQRKVVDELLERPPGEMGEYERGMLRAIVTAVPPDERPKVVAALSRDKIARDRAPREDLSDEEVAEAVEEAQAYGRGVDRAVDHNRRKGS
jgi:hypothetical protein